VKLLITALFTICAVIAADTKSLPNQAGNGNIDLAGTVILDPNEIQQLLGAPMEPGYVVVKIKVSPRTLSAIRVSSDDFAIVSRKDGERSPALDPSQITGVATLALRTGKAASSGPGDTKRSSNDALEKILESKILPDKETKDPVEGLLYFLLEGKNKPKDLGLLYKGPAGRLAMDFK
jgi:hypothetical protein